MIRKPRNRRRLAVRQQWTAPMMIPQINEWSGVDLDLIFVIPLTSVQVAGFRLLGMLPIRRRAFSFSPDYDTPISFVQFDNVLRFTFGTILEVNNLLEIGQGWREVRGASGEWLSPFRTQLV